MKRLTWEKDNGEWGLYGYDIKEVPAELYGAVCKLHDYEKIGPSPEQLKEIDRMYAGMARRLMHYKKLEQQGSIPHTAGGRSQAERTGGTGMSEILFRGKRVDNGKWVEGCYIVDEMDENKAYIGYVFGSDGRQPHDTDIAMVDKSTVCRYTGSTDDNGRKIFEGDIVKIDNEWTGRVEWISINTAFCVFPDDDIEHETYCVGYYVNEYGIDIEIIGNIFDNPELLEGGAE